jgi:ABC-type transporter Mla subunit MlaD
VRVSAAAKEATATVRVQEDPRIQISDADRAKWTDAVMKAYELQRSAAAAQRAVQNLRAQITTLQESLRQTPNVAKEVNEAVKSLSDQVEEVQRKIVPTAGPPGSAGPPLPGTPRPVLQRVGQLFNGLESYTAVPTAGPPGSAGPPLPGTPRPVLQRVGQLFNGLESYTAVPTADQTAKLAELSTELKSIVEQVNRVIDEAVPNLNKQIRDSGVSFLNPGPRVPTPR